MSHTGIRLRVVLAGAGPILEGDSDWLHMVAVYAGGGFDVLTPAATNASWHQVMGGPVEIWIQPVMLPDTYPDDEDQGEEQATDICGKNVFPDHPEWGVICNREPGHEGVCARFDVPA